MESSTQDLYNKMTIVDVHTGLMSKGNEEAARLRRLLVDLQHPSFASNEAENEAKGVQGLNAGQQVAIKRCDQKDSISTSKWQSCADEGYLNMMADIVCALHLANSNPE